MSTYDRVSFIGLPSSQLASVVGQDREIILDTDRKTATIHDGQQPGGYPLLREDGPGEAVTVAGRTLETRVGDVANIKDAPYGAKGDGVTDDADALDAIQATLNTSLMGVEVVIPAGNYHSSRAVTITVPDYKTLVIRGPGAWLTFTGDTDGLTIIRGHRAGVIIEGVEIVRGASSPAIAHTGLLIDGSATGTESGLVKLTGVIARGAEDRSTAWSRGVVLDSVGAPDLFGVRALMPDANGDTGRGDGIVLRGSNGTTGWLVDATLYGCFVQGGYRALHVEGWVQGVYVNPGNRFIGCEYGVYWDDPGKLGQLLNVIGSHINARSGCVHSTGGTQVDVSKNLFLRFNSDSAGWIAVYLYDAYNSGVEGNRIYGNLGPSEHAVWVEHSAAGGGGNQPSWVNDNAIAAINGSAVVLAGTTSNTEVMDNVMDGVLGPNVVEADTAAGNPIFNNPINHGDPSESGRDITSIGGVVTAGGAFRAKGPIYATSADDTPAYVQLENGVRLWAVSNGADGTLRVVDVTDGTGRTEWATDGTLTQIGSFVAAGSAFLGGAVGSDGLRVIPVAGANRRIEARASNGGNPGFTTSGGDLSLSSASGSVLLGAGASNYHYFNGSAAGAGIDWRASGADANVGLNAITRGAGEFRVATNGGVTQLAITHTASANRWPILTGSNGGSPLITTSGGDLELAGGSGTVAIRQGYVFRHNGSAGNISFSSTGAHIEFSRNSGNYVLADGASATINFQVGGAVQAQISNVAGANRYITLGGSNGGNSTLGTSAGGLTISARLRLSNLPTSSAGLSAGDIWNDAGTLKIV